MSARKSERIEPTSDDPISKLSFLFTYYASLGERMNSKYLKSHKFHKIMIDCGIQNESDGISSTGLDILFSMETKNQNIMELDKFLNFIPKLAIEKYPKLEPNKAFKKILENNLLPLSSKIASDSPISEQKKKLAEEIDDATIRVLEYIAPVLYKIYMSYFSWETRVNFLKREEMIQKSHTGIFLFCKEFEISPPLLTKITIHHIYYDLVNLELSKLCHSSEISSIIPFLKNDVGTAFSLSRFFAFIVRCSYLIYAENFKESSQELIKAERFVYLLEMMELSEGFRNLEKKIAVTHNAKSSLLIPKNKLKKILLGEEYSRVLNEDSPRNSLFIHFGEKDSPFRKEKSLSTIKKENLSKLSDSPNNQDRRSFNLNYSILADVDLNENVITIIRNYEQDLYKLFQFYCSFGEPMNTSQLKSIKFKRMLKEANILEGSKHDDSLPSHFLSSIDCDLIFAKLTGNDFIKCMKEKRSISSKSLNAPSIGHKQNLSMKGCNGIHGKMEFPQFIKSLEMICEKIYSEMDIEKAFNTLMEKNLLFLLSSLEKQKLDEKTFGNNRIEILAEIMKDPDLVNLLNTIYKPLCNYYNFYCDKRGMLNYQSYLKFCTDFQIFPDLLSKPKIMRIFYSLAQLYSSNSYDIQKMNLNYSILKEENNLTQRIEQKTTSQADQEVIDSFLFVQSFALCSLEIYFSEPQPLAIEKICFFLEMLNFSDGRNRVIKESGNTNPSSSNWDVLGVLRKKYGNIFGKKLSNEVKEAKTFNQLFEEMYLEGEEKENEAKF